MNKRFDPKRVALCGLLLSMMLVLGWVEHMIPLNAAIPGIKLGLSNGVLIFAVYMLDVPTSFVLMALKVVLSCAFLGNPDGHGVAVEGEGTALRHRVHGGWCAAQCGSGRRSDGDAEHRQPGVLHGGADAGGPGLRRTDWRVCQSGDEAFEAYTFLKRHALSIEQN